MNSNRRNIRLLVSIGIPIALFLALASPVAARGLSAQANNSGSRGLPNFQHVFVIMMENTSYTSLIGNSNAPFINSAAATYGLATKYFGVTHPSQPNYISATSGSTNGVKTDDDVTIDVPNIVDQLEKHSKSWKAYMQSLSLCPNSDPLQHACGNQLYERKHDPFVSYADVQNSPARLANIVDFSQFSTDLANNTVPNYSWISPDQCNDMHGRGAPASDPCSFDNEQLLIAAGDAFLQSTVNQIMNSQVWQNGNSTIFIAWDESDFTGSGPFGFADTSGCCDSEPGNGGGHVVTLVISNSVTSARTSDLASNHYSLLTTIEGGWSLGCLKFTCDTSHVKPMRDLVNN